MPFLHQRKRLQRQFFHLAIFKCDETSIQQRTALIICKRPALKINQTAADALKQALPCAGIPFAGRMEARVNIYAVLQHHAEFIGTAGFEHTEIRQR